MVILYILLITTLKAAAPLTLNEASSGEGLQRIDRDGFVSVQKPTMIDVSSEDAITSLSQQKNTVIESHKDYHATKDNWTKSHSEYLIGEYKKLHPNEHYSYEVDDRGIIWVIEDNTRHIADLEYEGFGNSSVDAQAYEKYAAPIIEANWEEYSKVADTGYREDFHKQWLGYIINHPQIKNLKLVAASVERAKADEEIRKADEEIRNAEEERRNAEEERRKAEEERRKAEAQREDLKISFERLRPPVLPSQVPIVNATGQDSSIQMLAPQIRKLVGDAPISYEGVPSYGLKDAQITGATDLKVKKIVLDKEEKIDAEHAQMIKLISPKNLA